jgi:mannose-6-phosphate isomerase-like protein (cupin superfamily)
VKPDILKAAVRPEVFTEERCFILERWNSELDPGVSIARARVEPGVTTALHSLSVDERYVVIRGRGQMEVEGLAPTSIESGDVVLIPAGRRQRVTNTGDDDLIFLCLCTPRFEPRHYSDEET